MSIISDARELYHRTIKSPEYTRSHIWDHNSDNHKNLIRIINTCETPEEVIEELLKTDMYAIRIHDTQTFDLMMEWYNNNFKMEMDITPLATPNLWKMFLYCCSISFHCDKDIGTIVELGGGNGQFSYMAKRVLNNRVHIDIDIPESLYMAYVCTRHFNPGSRCYWPETPSIFNHTEDEFIFLPVGYEDAIKGLDFDLFVNTASMGELPNNKIRYWMNFVQNHINVKYFYGLNRFLNTIDPEESGFSRFRENENEASVLFDHHWQVLKWEIEPFMTRCPYEDPKIARYLEIILKRDVNNHFLSCTDLSEIKMQDWWRYREERAIGTFRSNQLVNDFTQNGTLFKLWNCMRIDPSIETIEMILEYCKHIGKNGIIFEEELYYKKLLSKMVEYNLER